MAIPLSKDTLEDGNLFLTREATVEEIHQTVTQISSLEAPGPNNVHALSYQLLAYNW